MINIGRGHHVAEPELVSALVEGRLGGAGFDVFQYNVPEELKMQCSCLVEGVLARWNQTIVNSCALILRWGCKIV